MGTIYSRQRRVDRRRATLRTPQAARPWSRPSGRLTLPGNHLVIRKDHLGPYHLGGIDRLELLHGIRLSVTGLGGGVSENEKMDKLRGVLLFLPGEVHLGARLVGLHPA